jgi:glycosyltransferase involved in cell wall biosynthesis
VRIAILTSSLPPHPIGGAEHQALDTARRLGDRGHRVTVYARRLPPDSPPLVREANVTWVRSRALGPPGVRFASHVERFLRDWRRTGGPEHEVILAYQMVINGFLATLAPAGGAPVVTWVRCESEGFLFRRPWTRGLARRVLARSARLLFQDEAIRDPILNEARRRFGERFARDAAAKAAVLPNAIRLGEEPAYDGREGLVFLGRLTHQKAPEVLIEALRRLPHPPPLRVIGDGDLRPRLEAAATGLPVTFVGRVPEERVAAEIARARALVFPSRWEGFPNAVLEALERGLPVVASDVGAVRTLVRDGETGALVPPEDPAALAGAIERVLGDDGRWGTMARRARELARGYGWETHLERLETILAEASNRG